MKRVFYWKSRFSLAMIWLVGVFLVVSCNQNSRESLDGEAKVFTLMNPESTGIIFSNDIEETHEQNVILYQDFYSGGGVGIGDINNDGLPDVLLTGNMVQYKLFLNKGNMKFEDITERAGLIAKGPGWYTGIAMADVNSDGYLDLYISKSGMLEPDDRRNLLYINNGDLTFTEKGKAYGLDHPGYAVNATFFDYDKDGDLDMYLVNQGPEKFSKGMPEELRKEVHPYCGDKLFENMEGHYEDVTEKAGIWSSIIGFGHGVSVGDINQDGWEDIFVSNDFFEYDYLYFNNGDKTFRETTKKSMRHISNFSMGNDMADYNNDGWLDIVVTDMVAEDNRRLKANMGGMNPSKFWNSVRMGLHYQYMFNMLHLNNGNETFSEIGQMAGIPNTDWTWGPVFADFDNDGFKDLFIANGMRKDIRNTDWGKHYKQMLKLTYGKNIFSPEEWDYLLESMPVEKINNYMYKNKGDLTFTKVMDSWGLGQPSFSNGSAYGDLDNDGDLDLVVNNIDENAFVYENNMDKNEGGNYLRISFEGPDKNLLGLGTKVWVYCGDSMQFHQLYLTHGYRSSSEPVLHFGLGKRRKADKVLVTWLDGKSSVLENVEANQELVLKYSDAGEHVPYRVDDTEHYFVDATDEIHLKYKHIENEFNDYFREVLLPHKMSTLGPNVAVGDVNGDGLQDFYVGGSYRLPGSLFLQNGAGTFRSVQKDLWLAERGYEDMGVTLFDADGDGDLDLYVVSGGNEVRTGDPRLQDRLYRNDGKGVFTKDEDALPDITASGSKAVPYDFDGDGDLDLFVGGRQDPGRYPQPADSYLLRNDGRRFMDITDDTAPELRNLGMVTSAIWIDYDTDGDADLILAGEWMPITVFNFNDGKFKKVGGPKGLEHSTGWWYSLAKGDFDGDGDEDIIAGNLGLNYKYHASVDEPFEVYSYDFDENGKLDIVLGYFNDGTLYPLRGRSCSSQQIPQIGEKFPTYNEFAIAPLQEVYGEDKLSKALNYKAQTFASGYIENLGDGTFRMEAFENMAQVAPVFGIVVRDVNRDGNPDVITAGNLYNAEIETIRADAGIGNYLQGDGGGHFKAVPFIESGLYADGDVKDIQIIEDKLGIMLLVARNNDKMKMIRILDKPEGAIAKK